MTWLSTFLRRGHGQPCYALPVLTALFESHGFRSAGFSRDDNALTGAEVHYFTRHDCTYSAEFGLGQHTYGDMFMAVGANHQGGPKKTPFVPLSYFADYKTTLNRLLEAEISKDQALAESVAPHIEYAARVALLAYSRGRSIPLRADLDDIRAGGGGVEP